MGRELDAQIDLKIMGACGDAGHDWETTPVIDFQGSMLGGDTFCAKCGRERGVYMTPAYSTDLNACATAEARIISMGLGRRYARELEGGDYVAWESDGGTDYAALARIITASAEVRCRAMLAVMEGK